MYCHLPRNYSIGRTNGKHVLFTSKIIKSFITSIYQPKYLPIGSAVVVVVVVVGAGEKDKKQLLLIYKIHSKAPSTFQNKIARTAHGSQKYTKFICPYIRPVVKLFVFSFNEY